MASAFEDGVGNGDTNLLLVGTGSGADVGSGVDDGSGVAVDAAVAVLAGAAVEVAVDVGVELSVATTCLLGSSAVFVTTK